MNNHAKQPSAATQPNTSAIQPPPFCLTVAGSDPSGGAGIQGDLKTFCAHGAYGMAVITALTAQNTTGVMGVVGVEPSFVVQQLEAIYADIPTRFVKTGMLLNAAIIQATAAFFARIPDVDLVVDPVMISSSGARLLEDDAVQAYRTDLFPIARVITPNNLETHHFTGIKVSSVDDAIAASMKLLEMGARAAIVKGGDTVFQDSSDMLYDVLNDNGKIHVFERQLVGSRNSHGTGCAFAAALTCELAGGSSLADATSRAGEYVGAALAAAYPTGKGSGSINHLWNNCLKKPAANR